MTDSRRVSSTSKVNLTARVGGSSLSLIDNLWAFFLESFLENVITSGSLTLVLPDNTVRVFGQGAPHLTVEITNCKTVQRIVMNPDLAVGEAYMRGTLRMRKGNIYDLLALCLSNIGDKPRPSIQRVWHGMRRLLRPLTLFNPQRISRRNAAHHYNLTDALYDTFLDRDRQYSCAYFRTPEDTLDQAQKQKKELIAAKLALKPGQRVLDIGSGWGGLALSLAVSESVSVTGLTLSTEQHRFATAQALKVGLGDKVAFHLRDYRQERDSYDRIVSVGMFEHVGPGHYRAFFRQIADRLEHDGVALIHMIGTSHGPGGPHPWINKYIFPGGYVPAMSEVLPAIEKNGLVVTDIEVLRLHYARTLQLWRQRFMAQRDQMAALYDDEFCRMWEFYLAACEAGFRHNGLVVFQMQIAKQNAVVPVTRNYLKPVL